MRVDANKIDVLNLTERLEVEEVNAVDVVQEIVEITLDSGAAKSVWSIRNKGATSAKATKTVRWRQQQIFRRVEGDTRLVDEGNIVMFRPQESYIDNSSIGQRLPMNSRQEVFVMQLDARADTRSRNTVNFDEPNTDSVCRRPA